MLIILFFSFLHSILKNIIFSSPHLRYSYSTNMYFMLILSTVTFTQYYHECNFARKNIFRENEFYFHFHTRKKQKSIHNHDNLYRNK